MSAARTTRITWGPRRRLATIAAAGHHAAGDNPESTVGLVTSFLADIDW